MKASKTFTQKISTEYVRGIRGVAEYFHGDVDAFMQAVILDKLPLAVLLPIRNVRLAPLGYIRREWGGEAHEKPSDETILDWQPDRIRGWKRVPAHYATSLAVSGSVAIPFVWESLGRETDPADDYETRRACFFYDAEAKTTRPLTFRLDTHVWMKRSHVEAYLSKRVSGRDTGERPIGSKERNNLLRVIKALASQSKISIDEGGNGAVQIERAVAEAGFDGPKEKTIRQILAQARQL